METFDDNLLKEAAWAEMTQRNQREKTEQTVAAVSAALRGESAAADARMDELDALLLQAEQLAGAAGLSEDMLTQEDYAAGERLTELTEEEREAVVIPYFEQLATVDADVPWETYMANVRAYADENQIELTEHPWNELLTQAERDALAQRVKNDYLMKPAHCDGLDYGLAALSGFLCGLVDVFFVGAPNVVKTVRGADGVKTSRVIENSPLGTWTDKKVDQLVLKAARMKGWKPGAGNAENVGSAIGYLERNFAVNYDQNTTKAAGGAVSLTAKNHHLKSLAHAPDLIGLVFSVLDQFLGEAHFIDQGKLVRIDAEEGRLVGGNFCAKLFCGVANWLFHIFSDLAGSSGSRGAGSVGRGAGLPAPLFELLQFFDVGSFTLYKNDTVGQKKSVVSLAELSVAVYEHGYDTRFAATMAIPVVLNDLLTTLFRVLKRIFHDHAAPKDAIALHQDHELRRMLLVSQGVFVLIDAADAGIRSGGQILNFALRLNFVAWKRLAFSGLMELRALYKENALDVNLLDRDLEREWEALAAEEY